MGSQHVAVCGLVDCLVFDGCEPSEGALAPAAVVGPLDPGDDGQPQVLTGLPALAVQGVLLQQGEERFHGGVVAAGPDTAHGPGQASGTQRTRPPGAGSHSPAPGSCSVSSAPAAPRPR